MGEEEREGDGEAGSFSMASLIPTFCHAVQALSARQEQSEAAWRLRAKEGGKPGSGGEAACSRCVRRSEGRWELLAASNTGKLLFPQA